VRRPAGARGEDGHERAIEPRGRARLRGRDPAEHVLREPREGARASGPPHDPQAGAGRGVHHLVVVGERRRAEPLERRRVDEPAPRRLGEEIDAVPIAHRPEPPGVVEPRVREARLVERAPREPLHRDERQLAHADRAQALLDEEARGDAERRDQVEDLGVGADAPQRARQVAQHGDRPVGVRQPAGTEALVADQPEPRREPLVMVARLEAADADEEHHEVGAVDAGVERARRHDGPPRGDLAARARRDAREAVGAAREETQPTARRDGAGDQPGEARHVDAAADHADDRGVHASRREEPPHELDHAIDLVVGVLVGGR
jgi:hypothetical protein